MPNHQLFQVGQKAFIEKDGAVLVLNDPMWGIDFPGGRIDVGEFHPVGALKREIDEECGLIVEVGQPFTTWIWQFPKEKFPDKPPIYLVGYRCQYLSGEIKLSEEHIDFVWATKENYAQLSMHTLDRKPWVTALDTYFSLSQ